MDEAQRKDGSSLRVLVIGSVNMDKSARNLVGGTVVSLRWLIDELERRPDLDLRVLDIARSRGANKFLADVDRVIKFVTQLIGQVWRVDVVSLHTVTVKVWFTAIVTLMFSRLAGKPVVIRKFDGRDYDCFPFWKKALTKWALSRCDMYLAETKYLVEVAQKRDRIMHSRWFPNHRPFDAGVTIRRDRFECRRFIYVGRVCGEKGIAELVQATERLTGDVTVDVYGPLSDDLPPDLLNSCQRVFYKGVLTHQEVLDTMRQYDALVLPTYCNDEGYPGAILEAYGAGLPVIATKWQAIPEIVDESCGILVEPKNVEELFEAMKRLSADSELYVQLCRGAAERAGQFSAEFWADRFASYCLDLRAQKRR